MFYNQPEGEIYGRIACLLQVYVVGCVWMMEILPELHADKMRFVHEREVNLTTTLTACLSAQLPMSFMLILETISFGIPLYYFAGYRPGVSYVVTFLLILYLSMVLNSYMAHLIVLTTPSARTSIVIYSVRYHTMIIYVVYFNG